MSKHLTRNDVNRIVSVIQSYNDEKLTWEKIRNCIEPVIGKKPTRQTLSAHKNITEAYQAKKNILKSEQHSLNPKPSSLAAAGERITRLRNDNLSLKRKNQALLERFVIWQYNAYKHGLTEAQLNSPLPRIDRERT